MLQQFTWGQFLLVSTLLTFLWYVFVVLKYYRGDLGSMLFRRTVAGFTDEGIQGAASQSNEAKRPSALNLDESVMGKSADPVGMSVLTANEISFSHAEDKYDQVGLVADVLQELKLIFVDLEKQAGSKADFFRHLEKLKETYGSIGGHPNIVSINKFILEHAPFHLTGDEIENLWY